jgi:hypothetical protein
MFMLDYDKMLLLDAEDLAEGGILQSYQSIREILSRYVAEPAQIQEVIDDDKPSYVVRCGEQEYVIYSPALPDDEGQSWRRAAHAFFAIVNDQLSQSERRLYAINRGNDLGGMFLTQVSAKLRGNPCLAKRTGPTCQPPNIRGMASTIVRRPSNVFTTMSSIDSAAHRA